MFLQSTENTKHPTFIIFISMIDVKINNNIFKIILCLSILLPDSYNVKQKTFRNLSNRNMEYAKEEFYLQRKRKTVKHLHKFDFMSFIYIRYFLLPDSHDLKQK